MNEFISNNLIDVIKFFEIVSEINNTINIHINKDFWLIFCLSENGGEYINIKIDKSNFEKYDIVNEINFSLRVENLIKFKIANNQKISFKITKETFYISSLESGFKYQTRLYHSNKEIINIDEFRKETIDIDKTKLYLQLKNLILINKSSYVKTKNNRIYFISKDITQELEVSCEVFSDLETNKSGFYSLESLKKIYHLFTTTNELITLSFKKDEPLLIDLKNESAEINLLIAANNEENE